MGLGIFAISGQPRTKRMSAVATSVACMAGERLKPQLRAALLYRFGVPLRIIKLVSSIAMEE